MELKDFVQGVYGTMYYVRDMKKATEYYKALYGKEPAFQSDEWTTFHLGGSSLCLHSADGEIDGKGILIHNTLRLKETIPTLKAMGIEIVKDYHSVCEGGYAVDVRDPSGNLVSFFEYTGQ